VVVLERNDVGLVLARKTEAREHSLPHALSCFGILVFVVVVLFVFSHCVVSESALHRLEPTVVIVARLHANPTQPAVVCGH
jgi:hypothetical protein